MTQEAVVTKNLGNGMAEIVVTRQSACGGNCASCQGCAEKNEMRVQAYNPIEAKPGQRVVVESSTAKIIKAAALVYIMPLLFFLLFYALGSLAALSEGLCVLLSFGGLALGAIILVLIQKFGKSKERISVSIVRCIE